MQLDTKANGSLKHAATNPQTKLPSENAGKNNPPNDLLTSKGIVEG